MPVTFPSHQGIIVGAKLRWPSRIDGTALCIGAATPDLAYALTRWLAVQSHTWVGVLVWATPVAIVAATLVRWRAAAGIFAQLPDCGPLRLRSYRVLGRRSPHIVSTVLSAFVGSASHSFVDAFTHEFRWGANWLGLNDVVLTLPIKGPMTGAGILQYVGHSFGSLAFVVALFFMASTGKLEEWYGESDVADARDVDVSLTSRLVFWSVTVGPIVAAILLAPSVDRSPLFAAVTASFVGILTAGSLVGNTDRNQPVND